MRKQLEIQGLVVSYMDTWSRCMEQFREAWETYLSQGPGQEYYFRVGTTHKEESRADDLRRQIEHEMYAKALIPESRGDILGILEAVDVLLSDAEQVLFDLQFQEVDFPAELKDSTRKLVGFVCSCAGLVDRAVRILLGGKGRACDVAEPVDRIDSTESEADHLERGLVRMIFKADMDTGHKILLRDVVRHLGHMCDVCERIGDRLTIASVKRRV